MLPIKGPPELSVIIVNWNSCDFLSKCLKSLRDQGGAFETIVIDNASWDGCGEMIATEFPEVRFIQNGENLGFGGANNAAFSHSTGRLVLFLNPDTEVSRGAIRRMIEVLDLKADAGIIGAKLLNEDGSIQTSCIQRFPTIAGVLLDSELLRNLLPRWSLWGMRPLFENSTCPVPVDAVSGACQMVRREVFQRVGMYNNAYFMYAEDIDLCWKTSHSGLKNYYVADAVVTHYGGKSSSAAIESGRSAVIMRESWRRFFDQHRSRTYARVYRTAVAAQAAIRVMLIYSATLVAGMLGRHGTLDMIKRKWMSILRWALGMEPWAEQITSQ